MPATILSSNMKCGCSINLPIKGHCNPTKVCSFCCYGRLGHTSRPKAKAKQLNVTRYLAGEDLSQLISEIKGWKAVRLSGTGDLNMCHVPNIIRLADACPETQFWGMTRKMEIAYALNGQRSNIHLLLSVDSSSPKKVWGYTGLMCWGPRLKTDTVPDDPRIITVFPYHSHGKVVKGMPRHHKDCKAVWHEIECGKPSKSLKPSDEYPCLKCGRCWAWQSD